MKIMAQQNYNQNPNFTGLWRLSEGGKVTTSVLKATKGIMAVGKNNATDIADYRSVKDGIYLASESQKDINVFKKLQNLIKDLPNVEISYLNKDVIKDGGRFSSKHLPINEYFNPTPQAFVKYNLNQIG